MASLVENNPFDTQPKSASPGIVGGAMQAATPTVGRLPDNVGTTAPATPNVATYSPTTRQIDKSTGTVQGQVDSILAKDSPLMGRARTLATQQMAQRGLVNSSMAQGAGVAAMIDRATPIAQQDANAYNQVGQENMGAINNAGQFNASEMNKFGMQKNDQSFSASQADINRGYQTSERVGSQEFTSNVEAARQGFTSAQAALDRAQQTALNDKGIKAQQDLQTAQQNFGAAQSALDRAQQAGLQESQQRFQSGEGLAARQFQAGQSEMDRSQQSQMQSSQQQFQAVQSQIQNDFNMKVQQLQESGQDFRQAREIATREAMTKLEQQGITNRFDQELALKSQSFNVEQYNIERRQILQNEAELNRLGIQIKANNAQIPTTFAANISNTAMSGVNAIMTDGNLSGDAKKAAIENVVGYANSQIAWASKFYGTTIPPIETPGSSKPASTTP